MLPEFVSALQRERSAARQRAARVIAQLSGDATAVGANAGDPNANDGSVPSPAVDPALQPVTGQELGALWDRHSAGLILFARQWCGTAEDVVQESFWRLSRQTPRPNDPAAWLFTVVRNAAYSAVRGEQRRRYYEGRAALEKGAWFTAVQPDSLDAAQVTAALRHLPPEQRELIVLHIWSGLTFQQIAAVTQSSSSTAHRKYEQALTALRAALARTKAADH